MTMSMLFISDSARRLQRFNSSVASLTKTWSHTAFWYALAPSRTQADKYAIISELYRRVAELVASDAEEISKLIDRAGHILFKKE